MVLCLLFPSGGHHFLQSTSMNAVVDTAVFFAKFLYYFLESLVFKVIPKKKKDVAGEIVLITGAGSGLGRLLAMHFASHGAILVLWDINQEGNMETCRLAKEKGGVKVFTYKCDCSNRKEVYRVADQVSLLLLFALFPRKLLLACAQTGGSNLLGALLKILEYFRFDSLCLKCDSTASKSSIDGNRGSRARLGFRAQHRRTDSLSSSLTSEPRPVWWLCSVIHPTSSVGRHSDKPQLLCFSCATFTKLFTFLHPCFHIHELKASGWQHHTQL